MASPKRSPRGRTGARGKTGKTGPRGPSMKRSEVLAIVEDQFREIRKKLDLQLHRIAQIQAQLDQLAGLIARIVNEDVSDLRGTPAFKSEHRLP
jgi:hypothetical protein